MFSRNFGNNFSGMNFERLNEIDKQTTMQRINAQTQLQIADAIDSSLKEQQKKNERPSLMLLAAQLENIQHRYAAQRSLLAANHNMLSFLS